MKGERKRGGGGGGRGRTMTDRQTGKQTGRQKQIKKTRHRYYSTKANEDNTSA